MQSKPLQLQRVPWTIRDLVSSVLFSLMTIVAVLAAAQTAESIRIGEAGDNIASAGIGLALALGITLLIARISHIRLRPALLIVVVAMAAGAAFMSAGGGTLAEGDGEIAGVPVTIILFSIIEGIFLATAVLYGLIKHDVSKSYLGLVRASGPRSFASAIGYWALAAAAVGLWVVSIRALGIDSLLPPESAEDALNLAGGSIVLAVMLVGIWGPIAEEVFFRGFLMGGLRTRFGTLPAVLVSSAIFGMFHIVPGAMILTFLLGLAFAWIYIRTGSIWPAAFAHALQNTIAIVAASLDVSTG